MIRRKLAAGDYALMQDGHTAAVVERKTFDGFLADIGATQALHHQLEDLGSLTSAAVVIEAQYADFLDEKRLAGRWPAAHTARVLAELAALHPRLPIVFAGNRKLGNIWCARFFTACTLRHSSPQLDLVSEAVARYEATPRADGVEDQVRRFVLAQNGTPFAAPDVDAQFSGVKPSRIRRVLAQLKEEGLLECTGRGRGQRWSVIGQ